MGGEIWFESIPNVSTTFHVSIALPALGSDTLDLFEVNATGRRALVVADHDAVRAVRAAQLQWWGFAVTVVGKVEEAVEITGQQPYGLAVIDVCAPESKGVQCALQLRARAIGALPIVLVLPITADGKPLGGQADIHVVRKPVRQSHFLQTLQDMAQHDAGTKAATASPIFDPLLAERHPLRILLAEDNPVNQKVATQILARLGYLVDIVVNGQEAVDAIIRQHYDLVLMDVQMPEMDGMEATRVVRDIAPADRQPVIIAMTAAAALEDREACRQAGMDGFLSKPFQPDQLIQILQQIML